jgi:hypothetical protein
MSKEQFFSQTNEGKLQQILYQDICRRVGSDLSEGQAKRLMKTVNHYMNEVYNVHGGKKNMNDLNKEVLVTTLPDYLMYLNRKKHGSASSVISDIDSGPGEVQSSIPQSQRYIENDPYARQNMDIGNAFAELQASRQQGASKRTPSVPDFRVNLQDEPPVSLDYFERIKKDREDEARRQAAILQKVNTGNQGQVDYGNAGYSFTQDRRKFEEEAEEQLAEIQRKKLEARINNPMNQLALPPPPDMRAVFMGDKTQIGRTMNQSMDIVPVIPNNFSAGNPTLALPDPTLKPRETSSQQMIITREPDTMPYKETELNLFVYSGDRDWISNSSETRYNFSVNFDPANLPVGLRLSPTATIKFKNIARVELVKAIMPGENLDNFVTRTYSGSAFTYSSPYNVNVLSFPYVQVRIPELENNNYGTNQSLNAAFGVLQYDANWIYDTNNSNQRGYFAMIPKFLKCQKVYQPTPLATLNKLTFRFERPDGTLVSAIPDTLDITQLYSSKEVAASSGFPYGYDATVENGTSASYYFIKTSTYFNYLTVTKGDRIVVKNITWASLPAGNAVRQSEYLLQYLQQDAGLLVVDVGYGTSATGGITLGPNSQGYCNFIIVRGQFSDPTLGGVATVSLANLADTSTPGSLTANSLTAYLNGTAVSKGRLLNQSHQVQIALRVITREIDSTGFLRPDNL